MAQTAVHDTTTPSKPTLYVALELSKSKWKLVFATSRISKMLVRDVTARDLDGFRYQVEAARRAFRLPDGTRTRSCYEAGRDGFWIHRFLESVGIENIVLDPTSLEEDKRAKKPKTDGLDGKKMVRALSRFHDGEDCLRVVRVPPADAEDERILPRLMKTLKEKRTETSNQIRAALFLHGLDLGPGQASFDRSAFLREVKKARQWDGSPLPPETQGLVRMLTKQYDLLHHQIRELEKRQREALRKARRTPEKATAAQHKAALLSQLAGIGDTGSYVLATEFFGWRTFRNRKEVAALAGLTGTPHQSGGPGRDQGISKAGNPRVRTLMVELAWLWLRWQPDSPITRWFYEHVGQGGSRARRKAIVAVARKLLIELWHFAEHGVVPRGAVLNGEEVKALSASVDAA